MPRIRSIKPEFFLHEDLAELSAFHRLLFVGLWTLADKHGRLEDRPKRIKAALLPWDDCDMGVLLRDLEARGFIVRYEGHAPKTGERVQVIWIRHFEKHQKVHPKETAFDLPEPGPDVFGREISRQAGADNGKPEKGDALQRGDGDGDGSLGMGMGSASPPAADAAPPEPVEALQVAWNSLTAPPLPRWQETGDKRRKAAKARLRERPMSEWREVIQRIAASAFCQGENDRGWAAGPDFLLRPDTAAKVLEGTYDNRQRAGPARDIRRGVARAEDQDHSRTEVDADGTIHF